MCDRERNPIVAALGAWAPVRPACREAPLLPSAPAPKPALATTDAKTAAPCPVDSAVMPAHASRRRRLWDLPHHAFCPLVGVCLPMPTLRRLLARCMPDAAGDDDYALHCRAITDGRQRGPVAEAMQRELEHRHAAPLRQAAALKTREALAAWWQAASRDDSVAGALWTALTHPRCDAALEDQVLHDIHMLQHQLGVAGRADQRRLAELADENAQLASELAAVRERSHRAIDDKSRQLDAARADLLRLRGDLLARDSRIASLLEEKDALERGLPDLKTRRELALRCEALIAKLHRLEAASARSQGRGLGAVADRAADRTADEVAHAAHAARPAPSMASIGPTDAGDVGADTPIEAPESAIAPAPAAPAEQPIHLVARSVLCVGGRTANVPAYRRLIERCGARFVHHDGGAEQGNAQLEASLRSADLVICQTGCVSHDAYWRVKDHCKRTGKRCVYVDNPSSASLARALATPLQTPTTTR